MIEDHAETTGIIAGGIGIVALALTFAMGGSDGPFDEANGAVLACYSEFVALGDGPLRRIDWVEFRGSVEGRLQPLITNGMPCASEATTQAAELLVEMAAAHPIREAEKLRQCADQLLPLIETIKGL